MKNKYSYSIMLCLILCMCSCASYGPKNKDLTGVLSNTQQTITNLTEKIQTTGDKMLIKTGQKLESKYRELAPVLESCNEKYTLTTEYMTTLQEAQRALQRVDKDFNRISDKAFILDAIYLDYNAKLTSIKSNSKSDANSKIKVTVNSNEGEGFFVFGKLSYEQSLNIKRFRFNKPTQNASQDFVPGYYLFWLEKDERIGEPELHLIVSNGAEEVKQLVLKTPK
ncbi:hypothetical protein ABW636_12150 [Aquimarina sp. 2201CG1-2-11]|uniref:hypothetical protein n=1 Tax=Aquimarina discodermiae TaxID=3231043 RepID=UPI003462C945